MCIAIIKPERHVGRQAGRQANIFWIGGNLQSEQAWGSGLMGPR